MADLQKILNKFTDLGIENKGLTVDDPMQQGKALKEQYGASNQSTDATSHAKMVAESVSGKHIPGVSDISSSDMAALAGVSTSSKPVQAPQLQVAPRETYSDKWHEVDSRLSSIENKLNKVFEAIQFISEGMSKEEYQAKRKALQDIQLDPETNKDPKLKKELIRRKFELEKDYKAGKMTTEDSLKKGFASFLKELENN
tara:strand:- start:3516 stop:4112 length:597 start_codon:yes stop_codon:yes gene_type:complete